MFSTHSFRSTWLEVDLTRLKENLKSIFTHANKKSMIAVVKADGYGHGAVEIARTLEQEGVSWFAVATLDEAIELRENGVRGDILVLGPVDHRWQREIINCGCVATVVSLAEAEHLSKTAVALDKSLRVHVKVDTGMGRFGILFEQAFSDISAMMELPGITVEGCFSHLPSADHDREFSEHQIQRMRNLRHDLEKKGVHIPFWHIANSEAVWNLSDAYGTDFTHIRPGISLYGVASVPFANVKTLMTLKTKIVQMKRLSQGSTVSYLRTYRVTMPKEWIAVLPIGYADAVPVVGSGTYEVVIRGKRYPQVGRVCMDSMMVSLGENKEGIREGEEVEIFGGEISLLEFAQKSQRIPYEVMCGVSKRVPRIYRGEEK
ncbi:alanine racemase [Thermospira aquatica]|uniref:Alanine racemase n=1 Tax=Thermospira aquatica TaxID=2828656 RepID=A0AAX3BAR2_9SPIR|nr:alanine racemase [Thermospira aquatica]URA09351.1 alanine racemase [Thermospira aquatica]